MFNTARVIHLNFPKPQNNSSPLACGCGSGSHRPTSRVSVGCGDGGDLASFQWRQHSLSPTTTTTTASTPQGRGLGTHVSFVLKAVTTFVATLTVKAHFPILINICKYK